MRCDLAYLPYMPATHELTNVKCVSRVHTFIVVAAEPKAGGGWQSRDPRARRAGGHRTTLKSSHLVAGHILGQHFMTGHF